MKAAIQIRKQSLDLERQVMKREHTVTEMNYSSQGASTAKQTAQHSGLAKSEKFGMVERSWKMLRGVWNWRRL